MTPRAALVDYLRSHGDRVAVYTETPQLTYANLADDVAATTPSLGTGRRLVLLETRNDTTTLVRYLAALAAGHVVIPVPADRDRRAIIDIYDPDTVVDASGIGHRHRDPIHRLHDDLALLMSTSGSTGSPKLVRLSQTNLISNAVAIAEYLDIRETDRAATTLPISYCYGLSVVHSHLLRGAGLILTDDSVVDDRFWEVFRRHRGTSLAGVPHTFDLLDRIGFATMELPHLRYLTQAGGRMSSEQVSRWAEHAHQRGRQFFVMYGATEATARMAYLPPELALSHPGCIGRAIPGGALSIDSSDDWPAGTGELVYRGPNVMMGYAECPGDLVLGRTVDELRTGDIARRGPDGLYEIIGRSSRFVKLYGLRIDLQRLEDALGGHGIAAMCAENDGTITVAATTARNSREVQQLTAAAAGVPAAAVRATVVDELPRLTSGKPDYPAVRRLAATPAAGAGTDTADLRRLFADVLHLDPHTIDGSASFVDLGGNSLTYVTMSVRLEQTLGGLPRQWHLMPLDRLQPTTAPRRRWGSTVETSVALRAAAIVLIVGSHAELFALWGGAHVLLGVAGYNFGRFGLTPLPRRQRVRHLRNTIAWIAVPSIAWVAIALVLTDDYHASNLLLANKFLGPADSMTAGRLWFVEVLVWILVALTVLCWLPGTDRWERRRPFGFATAFLVLGLALRYDLPGFGLGHDAWFTVLAFWFFAAGWAAAKATTLWQRAIVTAVLAIGGHGYFGDPDREMLVLGGLVLLIWLPALRCPAAVAGICGLLAEASLYIYLTHFQVYPLVTGHPVIGVLLSLTTGVALTRLVTTVRKRLAGSSVPRAVGDQPLLHKRRSEGAVGADQTGRDDPAPVPGRR